MIRPRCIVKEKEILAKQQHIVFCIKQRNSSKASKQNPFHSNENTAYISSHLSQNQQAISIFIKREEV